MIGRILRSDWTLYVTRGGILGLNFLSTLLVATVIEPAEFGQFVYLWSLAMALSAIGSLGGPAYLMREGSARQGDPALGVTQWQAFKIAVIFPILILGGVGYFALSLPAPVFAMIGHAQPPPTQVVLVCVVAWVLILLSHIATPFRIDGRQTLSMLLRDAGPHLILLVAALATAGYGVAAPVPLLAAFIAISLMVVTGLAGVAFFTNLLNTPLWRSGGSGRGIGLASFWGNAILGTFSTQIDILLGGLFVSNVELGQYQIIKRLANLVGTAQLVANWAVIVAIGKGFAARRLDDVQAACQRGAKLALFPGLALAILITFTLPGFLWFFEIDNSSDTWWVFGLLVAGQTLNLVCGVNFTVAAQCGREKFAVLVRVLGLAAAVGSIIVLGDGLNTPRLAGAMLVAVAVSNLTLWYLLRRILGIDTSVFSLLRKEGQANEHI